VFFSTTQFPVCILGAYWKKKFGIPYVIDMQDPWHSDYYRYKSKSQQPPKYWFSYRLHRFLEPIAMRNVDGLISVSDDYLNVLRRRYTNVRNIPTAVITFGAYAQDLQIAARHRATFKPLLEPEYINIVYAGRGGADMHSAVAPVFEALQKGLTTDFNLFSRLHFYFIGTSYAPAGTGTATILPLAKTYGVAKHVTEITSRISYYHTLITLQQADALFIPGSDDAAYTASKLYPYLLTRKPILAIFNANSSVVDMLRKSTEHLKLLTFSGTAKADVNSAYAILYQWAKRILEPVKLNADFKRYSAEELSIRQISLFYQIIDK
jgi:hypothetical protein